MKKVIWPAFEKIGNIPASPLIVIETALLCREEARTNPGLALDVAAKLEQDPIPNLTDDEHEFLVKGLFRAGEKFEPPAFNRYCLRVLRALHIAESV